MPMSKGRSRAPIANKSKKPGSPAQVPSDQRRLANDVCAKLEQHINQVVASAPGLTADQRDRLALLLRGVHS